MNNKKIEVVNGNHRLAAFKSDLFKNYGAYDIKKLIKADWNYKIDDDVKKAKLKANIRRNGQVENIIIRDLGNGTFEVVNGNHRLDAFKEENFDQLLCYNCGKISLEDAQRIAIETNETKFETDNIKLSELLANISGKYEVKDLALTMPYSADELSDLIKLLDFDWDQFKAYQDDLNKDSEWAEIKISAPVAEVEIFYSELNRLKEVGKTNSDWVALKYMAVNSSQTPTESLE